MKTLLPVLLLIALCVGCTPHAEDPHLPRYVITSPEVAEIVYLLNSGENVVGVTTEVDYPAFFQDLPKVGRFGAISLERVLALKPSLVFTSGLEQEKLAADLNKGNIKTIIVYPQSIEQMFSVISEIAREIGTIERGVAVADSLKRELERLRYQGNQRPSVYVEIYNNPVMSVSESSFIGELIVHAGGDNIFNELPREYSRIRQEEVINSNPEIIILTYPGVTADQIKERKGWQGIAACQNDRIYTVAELDPDTILRAGPRIVEGLRELRKIFHGVID